MKISEQKSSGAFCERINEICHFFNTETKMQNFFIWSIFLQKCNWVINEQNSGQKESKFIVKFREIGFLTYLFKVLVRISELWVQSFGNKTDNKRTFVKKIKCTKSFFHKICGSEISLPDNLWRQLHPLHPC